MEGPNPNTTYPMPGFPQICFLKNIITRPNIEIGDYTYYDDPDGVSQFEDNVLYHFPFIGDRLRIGKFYALARGVKFIMNGANHQMNGISSYPFFIFGNGWKLDALSRANRHIRAVRLSATTFGSATTRSSCLGYGHLSDEFKRAIVAQSLLPNVSVSRIAASTTSMPTRYSFGANCLVMLN